MIKFITIITFFISSLSFGQMSDSREKQLDSLVTNIPRTILKNLDSVHLKIHSYGKTDEERVLMFYGLIATHYKYDMKRFWMRAKKAKRYTPHYTAYSRSGVCRDFAALFKDLCDRSEIPCFEVFGKTKHTVFLMGVVKFVTFKFRDPNHAWNIVKYNDSWHHMDPTWSRILEIDKYYEVEEGGNVYYVSKAKRPDRTYYNISYEDLYSERKTLHPAFLANDTIYTYKTIKRKKQRRRIYQVNYDFEKALDSMFQDTSYAFKKNKSDETKAYSGFAYSVFDFAAQFDFLEVKRTKYNPITVEMCENHLIEFKKQLSLVYDETDKEIWQKFYDHQLVIFKYMEKIRQKHWKQKSSM